MLEQDEIDDDYFTPVPSTSLANIFGGPTKKDTENKTLKYTPPKKQVPQDIAVPQNVEPKPEEDSKATECMFACALTAYEWSNNNYSSRGKLGFAILKIIKTSNYSIVLYNSNKTTLSNTLITAALNISLKGNHYISYYDNQNKYWSLYGKEDEIKKIVEVLKTLNIDVKHTLSTDQNPPEPSKTDSEKIEVKPLAVVHDKESDTDSSVNRRTKAAILNRMANMGQSVLPPSPLADESSDSSSDTSKVDDQPPKIRPKPTKTVTLKRTSIEKKAIETTKPTESIQMPIAKIDQPVSPIQPLNSTLFTMVNGQLIPVSNTNIVPSYGNSNNEMSLFMTEQRMNNNELRVNINRTTDKIDQVLEKLKVLDKPGGDTSFQVEVMQKLLAEYENKIKNYEQVLASKNQQSGTSESQLKFEPRDTEISNLQSAIEDAEKKIIAITESHKIKETELFKEIDHLKEDLSVKTLELEKLTQELNQVKKTNKSPDFEEKLKNVMNEVYGSIAVNFESEQKYSGDDVKKMLASVIKKATIQSLHEYNSDK
ncbi:hypothetical protein NE865_16518 [Phthorimaea operculella]|nr:hypothetical protein NE865_16518 [Phthorimaea operculella]